MTNSDRLFLLVTEEMSISKAAAKAFVTQQCVSEHIKRLEEMYNVTLFYRKPRLSITPAGETMRQALRQIDIIEKSMSKRLEEITSGVLGNINMGLNSTRAQVLLPKVLGNYHKMFPNVMISFILDDTQNMTNMLLKGDIDLMIGVNIVNDPLLKIRKLADDKVFMLIGEKLLFKHLEKRNQKMDSYSGAIDIKEFTDVPFVRNLKRSTITSLIDRHMNDNNLTLKTTFAISDYDIQINLCRQSLVAMFCPFTILGRVNEHNHTARNGERIHVFSVKDLDESLRVDLVTHKNALLPLYIQEFISQIEEVYAASGCQGHEAADLSNIAPSAQ